MKDLLGCPGSVSGLLLRIGQSLFAAASVGAMVSASGFSNFTAFCYLIASMGLQVLWSFALAGLDIYSLCTKRDIRNPVLVSLFVVGDWVFPLPLHSCKVESPMNPPYLQVTAALSLAAACSSAGIAVLYAKDLNYCTGQAHLPCLRFELSIALAFVTWLFAAISSHVMFWILASL